MKLGKIILTFASICLDSNPSIYHLSIMYILIYLFVYVYLSNYLYVPSFPLAASSLRSLKPAGGREGGRDGG